MLIAEHPRFRRLADQRCLFWVCCHIFIISWDDRCAKRMRLCVNKLSQISKRGNHRVSNSQYWRHCSLIKHESTIRVLLWRSFSLGWIACAVVASSSPNALNSFCYWRTNPLVAQTAHPELCSNRLRVRALADGSEVSESVQWHQNRSVYWKEDGVRWTNWACEIETTQRNPQNTANTDRQQWTGFLDFGAIGEDPVLLLPLWWVTFKKSWLYSTRKNEKWETVVFVAAQLWNSEGINVSARRGIQRRIRNLAPVSSWERMTAGWAKPKSGSVLLSHHEFMMLLTFVAEDKSQHLVCHPSRVSTVFQISIPEISLHHHSLHIFSELVFVALIARVSLRFTSILRPYSQPAAPIPKLWQTYSGNFVRLLQFGDSIFSKRFNFWFCLYFLDSFTEEMQICP